MNSFQRFKIEHLSASSLNLWRSAPGIWALRYIARMKDSGNPAMWRGTAVENGLAVLLRGRSLSEAISAAHQSFDLNAIGCIDESMPDERDLIAPMIEQSTRWKAPSALNATQLKIEYFFDPVPVPIIGWLDLAFEDIDIDLKTTKACPSSPRSDHIRQVSIYRAARNKPGGILYLTGKKHAYFSVDDDAMNEAMLELRADALAMSNFLARMETREDILRSLPVDYSHFQAPKSKVPLAEILLGG